jgi:hypothetical protein
LEQCRRSGPFDTGFRGEVERALAADIVEVPLKEGARGALAGPVQQLEEIEVGLHLA